MYNIYIKYIIALVVFKEIMDYMGDGPKGDMTAGNSTIR